MKQDVAAKIRGFVDSTDRSPLAVAFRTAGLAFSIPYSLAARVHHGLYDLNIRKATKVPCPTISIGNITMGGVGKSPFVAWLTSFLIDQGKNPGLISRGYKAKEQNSLRQEKEQNDSDPFARYRILNDEAREFSIRFPNVPYFLGHDRVEVANALLKFRPDLNALILDDAYQHRRIARDLNVVILDALNPFGGGHVAPSGFLREPLSALSRADAILLSRADLVAAELRDTIRRRALRYAPRAVWGEIAQRPNAVYRRVPAQTSKEGFSFETADFDVWRAQNAHKRIVAFCGLGAPSGFRRTLENAGLNVVSFVEFPDHCAYVPKDVERLIHESDAVNADVLLGTMKDFVKFTGKEPLNRPLYALGIAVEFLAGREDFCQRTLQIFD